MQEEPTEFYASSNGDKWLLEDAGANGELIVIHRANIASDRAPMVGTTFLKSPAIILKARPCEKFCWIFTPRKTRTPKERSFSC